MIDQKSLEMIALIMDQKLKESNAELGAKLDALESRMDSKLDALESRMDSKLDALESRMDAKLDALESRMDTKMETRFKEQEERLDKKLSSMEERLNDNAAMMEAQIKHSIALVDSRVTRVSNDVHDIKAYIENIIDPRIRLLAEVFVPAAKRHETVASDIENMKPSIEILNLTVTKHSKILNQAG